VLFANKTSVIFCFFVSYFLLFKRQNVATLAVGIKNIESAMEIFKHSLVKIPNIEDATETLKYIYQQAGQILRVSRKWSQTHINRQGKC
jgi:hypothetical protein